MVSIIFCQIITVCLQRGLNMKITRINMFCRVAFISAVCVSAGAVANDKSGEELRLEKQQLSQQKYDEIKDEVIVRPSAGCPWVPCPIEM